MEEERLKNHNSCNEIKVGKHCFESSTEESLLNRSVGSQKEDIRRNTTANWQGIILLPR